jgi:lipid II:glycine glycyltransferase (peptidoglycan interpeptide bridge formation enzyme)
MHSDVFTIEADGVVCAAHVFLSDARRVRMLFSATVRRSSRDHDRLVGLANRYLHWREIQHYRTQGVQLYDFGGVELDPTRPLYSVTQFKLSFGGEVVLEESVYLAANRVLRGLLRTASGARLTALRMVERLPPRRARRD